jgi:hypothetical protein
MNAIETALAFVGAINAQDVDSISDLMTHDHVYIDSDGTEVKGPTKMREGWIGYFSMVPDYHIEVRETFIRENSVVLLGTASGTFCKDGTLDPENRWEVPAAWRAVTEGERVAVWQLYVNLNASISRGHGSRNGADKGHFEAPVAQERAKIHRHRRLAERSGRRAQESPLFALQMERMHSVFIDALRLTPSRCKRS